MNLLISKISTAHHVGRPREFDEETVLAAAARIFGERGYHATTVDALCEATGLLRGSIYGAYHDKKGIFMAALIQYSEGRIARLAQSLRSKHSSRKVLREALLYYVQTVSDLDRVCSCFVTNTALELTPQDREVAGVIERVFRRMAALWSEAALRTHGGGSFAPGADAVATGTYLLCIAQGLRVLGKIYCEQELANIVDMALRALEKQTS